MATYVIVGNGVAGTRAAEAIRQRDDKGAITILGDDKSSDIVPAHEIQCLSNSAVCLDGYEGFRHHILRERQLKIFLGLYDLYQDILLCDYPYGLAFV